MITRPPVPGTTIGPQGTMTDMIPHVIETETEVTAINATRTRLITEVPIEILVQGTTSHQVEVAIILPQVVVPIAITEVAMPVVEEVVDGIMAVHLQLDLEVKMLTQVHETENRDTILEEERQIDLWVPWEQDSAVAMVMIGEVVENEVRLQDDIEDLLPI